MNKLGVLSCVLGDITLVTPWNKKVPRSPAKLTITFITGCAAVNGLMAASVLCITHDRETVSTAYNQINKVIFLSQTCDYKSPESHMCSCMWAFVWAAGAQQPTGSRSDCDKTRANSSPRAQVLRHVTANPDRWLLESEETCALQPESSADEQGRILRKRRLVPSSGLTMHPNVAQLQFWQVTWNL